MAIHTSKHSLAQEISEFFREKKRFRTYLGVIYKYGEEEVRTLFSEVKDEYRTARITSPVKIFFYRLKQLNEKKSKNK